MRIIALLTVGLLHFLLHGVVCLLFIHMYTNASDACKHTRTHTHTHTHTPTPTHTHGHPHTHTHT